MNTRTHLFLIIAPLLALTTLTLHAQPGLQSRRTVAPGVTHAEYLLPGPLTYDVLELELANPFIRLETYRPAGLVRTTLQSAANDRDGHRVIGAINADFFSFETGWPVGNQIVNGRFVLGVSSSRSHFALDDGNHPAIEQLSFRGRLVAATGAARAINSVNTDRAAGSLVFYTTYRGTTTLTDAAGIECAVAFLGQTPAMAETLQAVVTDKSGGGNMAIPEAGGILSGGTGAGASFLETDVAVGDTVRIYLGFASPLRRLLQAVGGAGRILMNGRDVSDSMAVEEGIGTSFTGARHPRSFFGFNSDTTIAYLCTVDGRQASSIGATFADMAGFLLSIGAWDGFNFDGGGSTTMVVRGQVVNSPSDPGGERSVANTLQAISTAPLGTLAHLRIEPRRAEAFQGGAVQFTVTGTDEYFNPISLPPATAWEADSTIGSIAPTGLFTARTANDSGWIRIRWNAVADSVFVVVRTLTKLFVTPPAINMVPGEQVAFVVRGRDTGGRLAAVSNTMLSFSASHPSLYINQAGLCTATDFGTGTANVDLHGLQVVLPFTLTGTDTTVLLDGFDDLFPWDQIVRINCDSIQAAVTQGIDAPYSTPPGLRVDYNVPSLPASIQLQTTLRLSGRPDSLLLDVYGGGNGDSLQVYVEDKDGDPFLVPALSRITWNGEWRSVGFRMNRAVALTGKALDFPITLRRLVVHFNNLSGSPAGSLLMDGLRAHYPLRVVTPQVLWDFEGGNTSGWQSPTSNSTAQMKGILYAQSRFSATTEVAYRSSYCGKWTFVDDSASSVDWDVRITRLQNSDLGLMLRGSYVGAWVYSNGNSEYELQTVIRDGNGQICAGPVFPVNHYGWKLIGTRLEESLFSPYLTEGRITDTNNKYNGFRVRAVNAAVHGKTKSVFIDRLVTSALTVPSGYHEFNVTWNAPLARLHWVVNSEISINRYGVERGNGGLFTSVGSLQATGNTDTVVHYEFVDTPPTDGMYQYRIRQITNDGAQELSPVVEINTATNSVGPEGAAAQEFRLQQNFPNPFNPSTTIGFTLPVRCRASFTVRNILGQTVHIRDLGTFEPGYHDLRWDALVASGVYFYTLEAASTRTGGPAFRETKRMIVVK